MCIRDRDWARTLFPASITNVAPVNVTAALGQRITVTGQGFGTQPEPDAIKEAIWADNDPLQDVDVRVWEDDQIVFVLPKQFNGAPWQQSQQFSLGIKVQGEVVRWTTPI